MKHLSSLALLTLTTPMWASTSAPSNIWHTEFSTGSLPAGVTVSRTGQATPVKGHYKHGFTENGWSVEQFDFDFCAMCPTSTNADTPIDALLTTPSFSVPAEGAVLTWEARSVLPGMDESYEVQVIDPAAENPCVLKYEVSAEASDRFVTRSLDLSPLAGRSNISVTFLCTSVNKYMLAINSISVGNSESYSVSARNTTARFAQNAVPAGGVFNVCGTLLNTGNREIPAGSVIRAISAGREIGSSTLSAPLAAAETADFSFPADPADNATSDYTVELVPADGSSIELFASDVTRSYFARNHFIDEGTGVWCNNCPQGALDIDALENEFPGQIIPVCTHVNDVFANDGYWPNLKFYAVPYFMLDRKRDTAYSDTRKFDNYLYGATIAQLEMKSCEMSTNGQKASISMEVTVSEDLDNSTGKYGIGYVLTAPFYVPDGDKSFMQQNMSSAAKAKQYYFLPTVIPSSLSFYRHVSLSSDYAFEPVPGSLPEIVKAYDPVTVELNLGCPDLVTTIDEATLVAYVLDMTNGEILNAVSYRIGDEIESNVGTGMLTVDVEDASAAPVYYTLQGVKVANPAPGQMVIERRGSAARKIVVR